MKWHILSRFGLELGLGTRLEDLSTFIRLTYPPSPSSINQSITSLSVSRFLLVQSARATCGARVQVGSKDETRLFAGCWLELHHHSIYFWTMDGEREDKEQLLSHRGRKGSVCCHGHGHEMRCMRTSTRVVAFEHSQSGHTERLERLRMNKSRGFCNLVWFVTSTPLDDPRKSLFPHFHFACFWVLGCLAASVGHQIQKKRRPFIRARLFLGFDMHLVLFRLLFLCVPAWDRIMCAVHVTTAYRYSTVLHDTILSDAILSQSMFNVHFLFCP